MVLLALLLLFKIDLVMCTVSLMGMFTYRSFISKVRHLCSLMMSVVSSS
jgi:hypothetical protein